MTTPLSELRVLYQKCVQGYIHATQVFENDTTGSLERITLDGTYFILLSRIIGLDREQPDPQLARFKSFIYDELKLLMLTFARSFDLATQLLVQNRTKDKGVIAHSRAPF